MYIRLDVMTHVNERTPTAPDVPRSALRGKKEGMAIAKNEEGKRWKAVEGDRHHLNRRIRAERARRPSHRTIPLPRPTTRRTDLRLSSILTPSLRNVYSRERADGGDDRREGGAPPCRSRPASPRRVREVNVECIPVGSEMSTRKTT